ncbi:MAG TPA: class I SAM-dependent methyltransferase [Geobacteraceae bacterium]|nr:class I SAM-dependent methyltransferase [Geobacteraceae bacterium]
MTDEKRDFDKVASTWDEEPRRVKLAADVAKAVIREAGLSRDMDILDYGCGTGLVALYLQPHVRSVTGADTSRGMLEVLRQKVTEAGITNIRTALIDPADERPLEGTFHLIVSSMTMHHVQDVEALFRKLNRLLPPGGRLCIADLDAEDGSFHGDMTGVAHLGFDRREIGAMMGSAGFSEVRDTTAAVIVKDGDGTTRREYPVFLMIAGK